MDRIPTQEELEQIKEELALGIGREKLEGDPMVRLWFALLARHFKHERDPSILSDAARRRGTDDQPATQVKTLHFVRHKNSMPEAESTTGRDLDLYITINSLMQTCFIHLSTTPSNTGDPHWSSPPDVPLQDTIATVDELLNQMAGSEV